MSWIEDVRTAINNNRVADVENLIKKQKNRGESLDIRDSLGNAAIHYIAGSVCLSAESSIQLVELLLTLEASIDLEALGCHSTALRLSASKEDSELFCYLLGKGANVPKTEFFQDILNSKLHYLAERTSNDRHYNNIHLLLKNGAKPNYKPKSSISSPLHMAATCGNIKTVEALLKYGADPTETSLGSSLIETVRSY
ncbi:ankyrin repeat domain-containing protein [Thiotrichales bacterium 19S9-12]|nr:ankyrin repeat domain-containing protein [Thiotrichales bacterium 19S9-11]MCF6811851.1 ankyrin repeat domain-containing protein [Thiotrichales bacterium 19S9-12]